MKAKLLVGVVSLLALNSVNSQAYQFEAGLYHTRADSDGGILDLDQDENTLTASYYFSDVKASSGPLGAATFIERTSSVGVSYSDGDIDGGPVNLDTDERTISGRYVDRASGWLVEAGYLYSETDTIDSEVDSYSLALGKYIAQYTTLKYEFTRSDLEIGSLSEDARVHGLSLDHLQPMENGMYWGVEASVVRLDAEDSDDDTNAFGFNATLFPINELELGLGLGRTESDNGDVDSYTISAEWFVTEAAALSLHYTSEDESGSNTVNIDTDTLVAGIKVRF